MLTDLVELVIGVDTHTDTHTAALLSSTGAVLATTTIATDPGGYADLLALAQTHNGLRAWAIEGARGYGAGLTRHLQAAGEVVIEIDRPQRPRRRAGKNDLIDAERAARDAMTRTHLAQPRTGPERGALTALLAARRGAVEASADAQRQLRALIVTAPEPVRARFRGHTSIPDLVRIATRLRLPATSTPTSADVEVLTTATVLRALARRITTLTGEADTHERAIRTIVRSWHPELLDLTGVGPIVAAVVLTAWSHPGRCRSDAAFAMLAGVAPIPASSGKTVRHRLNRCGDRQLNRALHTIVLSRLRYDPDTRAYADRRRAQNKTDREIRRCLKRYTARQLYRLLEHPPAAA